MDVSGLHWNDELAFYEVATIGNEMFAVIPMIFNHRVTVRPVGDDTGYRHAWCYPDMAHAIAAMVMWDPTTEPTPRGFIKQATPGMRGVPVDVT